MEKLFTEKALIKACLYTILWLVIFLVCNHFGLIPLDWAAISTAAIAVFFAFLTGYRSRTYD